MSEMLVNDLAALPVFAYADQYGLMNESQILEMADDIEKKGLLHRIVLWRGQILDGRNRLKALVLTTVLDVEVLDVSSLTEFEAVDYINSVNDLRRHDSVTERSIRAVASLPYLKGLPGKVTDRAAERQGISGTTVRRAKRVAESPVAADLWDEMKAGRLEVKKAYERLQERLADFEPKTAFIRSFPEVWRQYQSGELKHHEAWQEAQRVDAAQKRERELVTPEALLRIETLVEHPAWKEANLAIVRLETVAEVEKFQGELETLREKVSTAERAAGIRLSQIEEEG